jgi:hypothetical protein
MKTLNSSEDGKFVWKPILFLVLTSLSQTLRAEEKLSSNFANDLVKDGFIGYYIIGGILAFGILGYLIISLVRKNENTKEHEHPMVHKHHHHRHHHRVIKKSA